MGVAGGPGSPEPREAPRARGARHGARALLSRALPGSRRPARGRCGLSTTWRGCPIARRSDLRDSAPDRTTVRQPSWRAAAADHHVRLHGDAVRVLQRCGERGRRRRRVPVLPGMDRCGDLADTHRHRTQRGQAHAVARPGPPRGSRGGPGRPCWASGSWRCPAWTCPRRSSWRAVAPSRRAGTSSAGTRRTWPGSRGACWRRGIRLPVSPRVVLSGGETLSERDAADDRAGIRLRGDQSVRRLGSSPHGADVSGQPCGASCEQRAGRPPSGGRRRPARGSGDARANRR